MLHEVAAAFGERYRIERELGRGGMATVYLAHDPRHDRSVAIKVLDPALAAALGAERFRREIRVAARLQHPHILTVLDSGVADGGGTPLFYYVMPYVAGESLRARLDREGSLPVHDALTITRETADALDYAHRQGVVHRDVKPENILLSEGHVLLADFGIAKAVAGAGPRLTATGFSLGTPAYMSPEQASADPRVDGRSDVYSLGCVAYEMLAGEPPYTGPTAQAVIARRLSGPPPAIRTIRPQVPASAESAVTQALAVVPADRFPSAGAFAVALTGESAGSAPPAQPIDRPARRRWALALGGAALIAAAALLIPPLLRDDTVTPGLSTIAVLPFGNVGGDTAEVWFAEGMADELTTALAKVPGVRVAGRSSAARFREAANIAGIGESLGVGAVLAGTVRRAADRIRVSVELTSVADGLVLWSDRFDRQATDVFAVQDEIATAVVNALRGTLLPGDSATAPRGTGDFAAYDLYLKGRFALAKRGERGLRDAIDYFSQAVAMDPDFARGHAGLAMAYVVIPFWARSFPADSALTLAESSATRALALDSTLSDAHLALANLHKMRWRFDEAELHFRTTLALAPDDPAALHWYGVHLYATGRAAEAVAAMQRAATLDPFHTTVSSDFAAALWAAGRYPEALAEARRGFALDTTKSDAHLILGLVHYAEGRGDSALRAFRNARRLGTGVDVRGYESAAWRLLNAHDRADSIYRALRDDHEAGRALALDVAGAAAAAGDREVALRAIEQTMEERHMFVTELALACDPIYASIRDDSRFIAALTGEGMGGTCRRGPAMP